MLLSLRIKHLLTRGASKGGMAPTAASNGPRSLRWYLSQREANPEKESPLSASIELQKCVVESIKCVHLEKGKLVSIESVQWTQHPNASSIESSTDPLYAFDPEIELILRRLRRTRNLIVNNSRISDSVINFDQFCTDNSVASSNLFVEPEKMENNDRTLKELTTPDVLELAQTYELKSGLIHLLPKFHGLAEEDPYMHLKEFH
ncbi:hypothetical protein CR513_43966, partial [Mucuna pruriens]